MIVELLESGRTVKELSSEYHLNEGMIRRWRREYNLESSSFTNVLIVGFYFGYLFGKSKGKDQRENIFEHSVNLSLSSKDSYQEFYKTLSWYKEAKVNFFNS